MDHLNQKGGIRSTRIYQTLKNSQKSAFSFKAPQFSGFICFQGGSYSSGPQCRHSRSLQSSPEAAQAQAHCSSCTGCIPEAGSTHASRGTCNSQTLTNMRIYPQHILPTFAPEPLIALPAFPGHWQHLPEAQDRFLVLHFIPQSLTADRGNVEGNISCSSCVTKAPRSFCTPSEGNQNCPQQGPSAAEEHRARCQHCKRSSG